MSSNTSTTLSAALLLPSALIIWITLSFCQKRAAASLKDVCSGRPGVVYPINFLNPRHRLVYSLVCAAQASTWLNLLFLALHINDQMNRWISVFVNALVIVLLVLLVVFMTYPMLACVEAPIPIVGYVLGLIHSLLYFMLVLIQLSEIIQSDAHLSSKNKSIVYSKVIVQIIPQATCIVVVIIWYIYKLVKEARRIYICRDHWKGAIFEQVPSMNNLKYVKKLLRDPNRNLNSFQLISKIQLPLPILIATAVCIVIIMQLTFGAVLYLPYLLGNLSDLLKITGAQLNDSSVSPILYTFSRVSTKLEVLAVVAPILSTILIIILFGHLLHVIRKEVLSIRLGRSEVCKDIYLVSGPTMKLASYVRYTGFQVASVITGWFFYSVTFFLVGGFFGLVFFLPNVFGYILYFLIITTTLTVAIMIVQAVMCRVFFLTDESMKEKTIVLNNRRIFNSFKYTVLLYNIATGLYTSFIRIIIAFFFTLLIMPRLDKMVFVSPFQRFDTGHSMYRGFMITEALLNNPVVHTFVNLLSEQVKKRKNELGSFYTCEKPDFRFSLKAKNRWLVAYTLLNNPSIRSETFLSNEGSDERHH